jgi:phage tail sheath gpL-like
MAKSPFGFRKPQEFAMLRSLKMTAAAVLSLGFALAGPAATANAATHDGNWSVLIVTEKGTCDKAYRYSVAVANGQVRYQGDAAVNFNGTVDQHGVVKVSIRLGEQGASGTGRLAKDSGTGKWHGVGGAGECAGRWEAERR